MTLYHLIKSIQVGVLFLVWLSIEGVSWGGGGARSRPATSRPAPFSTVTVSGLRPVDAPPGMVGIAAGSYLPLYAGKDKKCVPVKAFWIDRYAVTNEDFLAFVRANPRWRRSHIAGLFADSSYLKHWSSDLELGPKTALQARSPVTHVSWFPAKYYCQWKGKRLPTTDEWEYVAAAGRKSPDGRKNPDYLQRILNWYSKPTPKQMPPVGSTFQNYWGVYDMHGLIWEWTLDFNTATITGDARNDVALGRKLFCGASALGASDFQNYAAFMRYAFRSSLKANYTVANLGFRCAKSLPPGKEGRNP